MATIPQMEANRLNAQKSTGPRSAEGKASSRFNAFKHGAYARARIIPGEDEADFTHISEDYVHDLRPEGVVELRLVDTLIHCDWEQRRIPVLEAAVIAALVAKQEDSPHALGAALIEDASGPNALQKLHRRRQAANREWFRAYNDLRKVQSERLSCPANPDPPAAEPAATPEPTPPPAEPTSARNEPNPAPMAPPAPQAPNPQPLTPNPQPPPPTPAPAPVPPTVASKTVPRGFNPNNPHHPPIELCPNCTSKGAIQDRCFFQPRQPHK